MLTKGILKVHRQTLIYELGNIIKDFKHRHDITLYYTLFLTLYKLTRSMLFKNFLNGMK
jgi:hypothetical protein